MLSDPMKDAVRYIRYRMRSRKEIEDQLLKKGYSKEEVDEVIEKLEEQKLVDDRVFASLYVSDGVNVHHKGPFRIRQELFKLGISEEIISDSIEKELENCDLKEIAKTAIGSTGKTDAYKMRRKLYRKGFSSPLIDEVIDEIEEKS